jgi:hypothetical protein
VGFGTIGRALAVLIREYLPGASIVGVAKRDPLIFSAITYGRNTHYFPVFFEATRASE